MHAANGIVYYTLALVVSVAIDNKTISNCSDLLAKKVMPYNVIVIKHRDQLNLNISPTLHDKASPISMTVSINHQPRNGASGSFLSSLDYLIIVKLVLHVLETNADINRLVELQTSDGLFLRGVGGW